MHTLQARGVEYCYPGAKTPTLAGIDLELSTQELVGLSSPSGTGKTTLCQVLSGYLAPTAGVLLYDGAPPQVVAGQPNPVQLIWQHPEQAFDPYLRVGTSIGHSGALVETVVTGPGIEQEWLSRFPHELSGRQLQRLAIARTVAAKPCFMIADEITTMLDFHTQAKIWRFLIDYTKRHEVGLLLVSHDEVILERVADRVVTLA